MELEALMQETADVLEQGFYDKPFYFSYSSLNKLLWNPAVFYQLYVMGIKEERTDAHLVQGKLIHLLLLEPEKFEKQFMMSPSNLPTGNPRVVIDRVFNHYLELSRNGDSRTELTAFEGAILDVMRDMNYFQNLKTDQQRIDKIINDETKNYWIFLKTKGDKTLIDEETYKFCKDAVELIKLNKKVCDLIGCNVSDFDSIEVFNELPVQCELPNKPFGIKGIIDNLLIDHDKKIIRINDMKTTSKELKDFPETIEYYSYWLQAAIYIRMVSELYKYLLDHGYQIELNFIVIDRSFQTYSFPLSSETSLEWQDRFIKVLDKAEWHYTNKNYELPYEFAIDAIVL
jgi:hypothetical protein